MMTFFSVSKSSTRKRRPQDVGEDVEGLRKILGQAGHVVERVFLGRLRIVLGADPIEVAVDGHSVASLRSLERHVLEEVRHAGNVGRLVAAARLHDETQPRPKARDQFSSAMTSSPLSSVVCSNCMIFRPSRNASGGENAEKFQVA